MLGKKSMDFVGSENKLRNSISQSFWGGGLVLHFIKHNAKLFS